MDDDRRRQTVEELVRVRASWLAVAQSDAAWASSALLAKRRASLIELECRQRQLEADLKRLGY